MTNDVQEVIEVIEKLSQQYSDIQFEYHLDAQHKEDGSVERRGCSVTVVFRKEVSPLSR